MHRVHLLGSDEMVPLINEPFKSNILRVSDSLMLPPATSLLNYGGVIELSAYWVDEADETVAISPLKLSPYMAHVISRRPGHISRLSFLHSLENR